MYTNFGEITPKNILCYPNKVIQSCGIGIEKVGYFKDYN